MNCINIDLNFIANYDFSKIKHKKYCFARSKTIFLLETLLVIKLH